MRRRLRLLKPGAALALGLAPLGLVPLELVLADPGRAAAPPGVTEPADPSRQEPVGRWELALRQCRVELRPPATRLDPSADAAPRPLSCRALRLDQQLPGLLSLRLLGAESGAAGAAVQLVLAGVLEPGSQPLRCRQLRCRPRGPVRMLVSAVARSGLPQDPGTAAVLRSQLAQGRCVLEGRRLQCLVRGADGEEWRVEAQR
ncbi:MAG: hypothetical protein ACK55X_02895 [Synechococcaceae cyanobacterium]